MNPHLPPTRHRPDPALDTDLDRRAELATLAADLRDVAMIAVLGLVIPLALLALVWCILAS